MRAGHSRASSSRSWPATTSVIDGGEEDREGHAQKVRDPRRATLDGERLGHRRSGTSGAQPVQGAQGRRGRSSGAAAAPWPRAWNYPAGRRDSRLCARAP